MRTSIGLLILRLGIGGFLLSHGVGKLRMLMSGDFAQFGDPIGIGNAASVALVTFSEFVCAGFVMVGWLTRLASLPIVFSMGVAAFVVHAGDPLSSETAAKAFFAGESKVWFSKQPALMFLIVYLAFFFTGAGNWSIDEAIRRRRARDR